MPRVSVVVPAYNSVAFIGATMRSILAQTFRDFELVVSDHSSTDGTWEALQPFSADPRVRLSRLPSGGGAPANWNAVTDLATGELVKLVCGDDLLSPDSLAEQVDALEAHPRGVLAASPRHVIDAVGTPVLRNRGPAGLRGEVNGVEAIRRTVLAGYERLRRAGIGVGQARGTDRAGGGTPGSRTSSTRRPTAQCCCAGA